MSIVSYTGMGPDDLTELVTGWPGVHSLAVADADQILGASGDLDATYRIASITKLFTSYAVLVAIEEGSMTLDEPAGPPGSTVRHLMAHTSGLAFDEDRVIGPVGARRIYSNVGFEVLATHLEHRTEMAFADYLNLGVLEPLGLAAVDSQVSPAFGMQTSVAALVAFGRELLTPTLIAPETMAMATSVVFPDVEGVLPGFGVFRPNPWGLGFEIRGNKEPHWTAPGHGPRTFGHFGGAGSFLWIDPDQGLLAATAGSEPFGEWAVDVWPTTNQATLDRYGR